KVPQQAIAVPGGDRKPRLTQSHQGSWWESGCFSAVVRATRNHNIDGPAGAISTDHIGPRTARSIGIGRRVTGTVRHGGSLGRFWVAFAGWIRDALVVRAARVFGLFPTGARRFTGLVLRRRVIVDR